MLNIIYEPMTNLFTFMSTPDEDKIKELGIDVTDIATNIDELLEVISGEFALFASCMAGNTEEAYMTLVDALDKSGRDSKITEALEEVYKDNKDTIFLNNEPKEECVEKIALNYKNSIMVMGEQGEGMQAILDILINGFIRLTNEMYNTDVSYVFEEGFDPDNKQTTKEDDDLFEEDLF